MKNLFRSLLLVAFGSMALRANPEMQVDLGGSVVMTLVEIPAGKFLRGSPAGEAGRGADEDPAEVTLSSGFLIGKTPITVAMWERFVAETGYRSEAEKGSSGGFGWNGSALVQSKSYTWKSPGFAQFPDHPVCMVTFGDSQAFCAWLERKIHRKVSLPTEAQWEYACRAGTNTAWHTGPSSADGDQAAWHKGNAANTTHPVNQKLPNAWGLIMGGNVGEWCLDWYGPYPSGSLTDPRQDNRNLGDKPRRVLRGGSWSRDLKNTRSAARWRSDPGSRNADIGFRVVCSTVEIQSTPPPVPPEPKVEAEPGASVPVTPVPTPSPPLHSPSAPSGPPIPSPGGKLVGGFGGLLCMLVPVGLAILLIRTLIGHGKTPSNPFVAPVSDEPEPPPPSLSAIRKTNDGFWIKGQWPTGSSLHLRYFVAGSLTEMDLLYRPGPEGHFVYTGVEPDSVSVVSDDGTEESSMLPPPMMPDPSAGSLERDRDRPASSNPPRFPSAY